MNRRTAIDFNCDLGEGMGDDAAILPFVSSASIACGFHAGGPALMQQTVALCAAHGVAIGAHPSFEDREHFGRIAHALSPREAYALTLYQIGALDGFVRAAGLAMNHVKPHGALYNQAARDRLLADALVEAVRDHDAGLIVYALSGGALADAARAAGLQVADEAFVERRYEHDGSLTPREVEGASIDDLDTAARQALSLLRDGAVTARTGEVVQVHADSLCLHGDRPQAAEFASALRKTIEDAGFAVRAPARSQARRT